MDLFDSVILLKKMEMGREWQQQSGAIRRGRWNNQGPSFDLFSRRCCWASNRFLFYRLFIQRDLDCTVIRPNSRTSFFFQNFYFKTLLLLLLLLSMSTYFFDYFLLFGELIPELHSRVFPLGGNKKSTQKKKWLSFTKNPILFTLSIDSSAARSDAYTHTVEP